MGDLSDDIAVGQAGMLPEFISQAGDRGDIAKSTASSLRSACKSVLDTVSDIATTDVRNIDVDEIVVRFKHRSRDKFAETTQQQYEQRFRQAVKQYRRWLSQPTGISVGVKQEEPETTIHTTGPPAKKIPYVFRVRPGVELELPLLSDMTRSEVDRLIKFLDALVPENDLH